MSKSSRSGIGEAITLALDSDDGRRLWVGRFGPSEAALAGGLAVAVGFNEDVYTAVSLRRSVAIDDDFDDAAIAAY